MNFRRIFISIICFFLSFSAVNAAETQYLYIVKNIPQQNLANFISDYFSQTNYKVINTGDLYILPVESINNNFSQVLLEQNGADCYFYYFSSDNSVNLNSALQRELKKAHLKSKLVKTKELVESFKPKALESKLKAEKSLLKAKNYEFDEEAQLVFNKNNNNNNISSIVKPVSSFSIEQSKKTVLKMATQKYVPASQYKAPQNNAKVLKGAVVTIASGTPINATLQSAVSSASMSESDKITAVLNEDFVYKGYLIFPAGAVLYGTAIQAKAATGAYGNGSLDLVFNQVLLPNGGKINLSVDKISYIKESKRAANITKNVAMGVGLGLLSGLLSATSTGDYSQALLVGASVGALGGGVYAAVQKGEEIEIPEGTVLNLRTNQVIQISPYN